MTDDNELVEFEQHDPQFTGWFIPVEIVHLFWERKITADEMLLLATVDSFVKRGKASVGCFASDDYLGRKMNMAPRSIRRALSKLRKLKLIRTICFDGRKRYMETKWSRASVRTGLAKNGLAR